MYATLCKNINELKITENKTDNNKESEKKM